MHTVIPGGAQRMKMIKDNSVELVVTSPPYPMIEMWDRIFGAQNSRIKKALKDKDGQRSFELMHQELDKAWSELQRVVINGGFVCINIGDATRTIDKQFALYPNHSRIISAFIKMGFTHLPGILWRKQTNAPNKFMGSGLLPAGAYVTLEHEWILIFRKGAKREFITETEKMKRRESAFFWEERNTWFSDLWDLKGIQQKVGHSTSRVRSAAYPFEIPYRLINMYSIKGDTVLDPFLGTGTTVLAAIASQRNSIGIEIDKNFLDISTNNIKEASIHALNNVFETRRQQHEKFVMERTLNQKKSQPKYFNTKMNVPVMTGQETDIGFSRLLSIEQVSSTNFKSIYDISAG